MAYERIHPAVLVAYVLSVTIPAMFSLNPVLHIAAFSGAVLFLILTEPEPPKVRTVLWLSGLFLLVVAVNPLFSHRGQTELFFLNGHAITLESILYGVRNALCVLSVLLWCRIFNQMVSSEKLLALLGRSFPKTALLLSSSLRLVPLLRNRASQMRDTQKELGLYGNGEMADRITGGAKVFSMIVTWSLDHATAVSSSMKARGYGLKGRTTYTPYRFRKADALRLSLILAADAVLIGILASGKLAFQFYPALSMESGPVTMFGLILYCLLVTAAAFTEGKNRIQWDYYRSKI
ncbi:MAG: hypothetical protein J5643_11515 [Lachnospiraceae bacterium]|nr:hypothetical protein [Lachnospiraceae bacterium]